MNWITWALLSAFFAGITAVLAKVGVAGVDSNLATAVRTTVVLVFTWVIALATSPAASLRHLSSRTFTFLVLGESFWSRPRTRSRPHGEGAH